MIETGQGWVSAPDLAAQVGVSFCGEYHAAKPGHNYYFDREYKSGGYFYNEGEMYHVIGRDYWYEFRCGRVGRPGPDEYKAWPQGWW